MGDVPPSPSTERSNLPMLYYGLVVVGTAAVVLAVYNLVIIKWCAARHNRSNQRNSRFLDTAASQSFENSSVNLVSSFKYKKEAGGENKEDQTSDYECAVCLSVFEDGEDVRQLPRCKHSFHTQCIDMWLYSHFDCPLCRAPVEPGVLPHQQFL